MGVPEPRECVAFIALDIPTRIAGLPFLSEQAKCNILGETARKVSALNSLVSHGYSLEGRNSNSAI